MHNGFNRVKCELNILKPQPASINVSIRPITVVLGWFVRDLDLKVSHLISKVRLWHSRTSELRSCCHNSSFIMSDVIGAISTTLHLLPFFLGWYWGAPHTRAVCCSCDESTPVKLSSLRLRSWWVERRCSLNLKQGHFSSGTEYVGRLYPICTTYERNAC